ncbi:HAMP domain-containing protein [Sneathiella sp. P13V-1]|uniref:ATP-binding protein n=1 Tax=Sneathiella sp. P13V-1 TaxID=2697366 RepID=UPI00187BA08A|nr:ATP-binding protein [Sneathiella sp. P13V-1]MBE7638170.1 HAMP domain-containing protein [Sneathiella sp. P13V-1]
MKKTFGKSIAFKQAKTAAIAAVLVGFIFSAAQLAYDYATEKEDNRKTANHILNTMRGPASEAAYNLSSELAEKVLDGMMENPQVQSAAIYAKFGFNTQETLATRTRDQSNEAISALASLVAPQEENYHIELVETSTNQLIGSMQLKMDPNVLAATFLDRATVVFLAGFLRNIFLTFVLVFVFYRTLTKPISTIAKKIERINANAPDLSKLEILGAHKDDELGLLVEGFNRALELLGDNLKRRRAAESEIRDNMYLFRALARSSSDIFWSTDAGLKVSLLSLEAETQSLNKDLGIQGRHLFDFLTEFSADDNLSTLKKIATDRQDFRGIQIKLDIDGEPAYFSFHGSVKLGPNNEFQGYLGTAIDITEAIHKDQEIAAALEQLRQAQKMEAVGQLTGGVAHDFNNLLAVIIGNLEIVSDSLEDQPELKMMLEKAIMSGEKGAQLTQQLLAFSRKQELKPRDVFINEHVSNVADMLERILTSEIVFTLDLDDHLSKCYIDAAQFENALLNLSINARDAMPGGGELTIRTRAHNQNTPVTLGTSELQEGEYIKVSVIDRGEGMTEDVRSKAMEPFFTTKDVGKGSGMGLAMVYGFIGQSKGAMNIISQIGEGTRIDLYLPCSLEKSSEGQKQKSLQES